MKSSKTDSWGVFVSYSRSDRDVVTPIVELMRVTGSKVFRDEDSISPGKKWRIVIAESLYAAKTVVVFWCKHSSTSSAVKLEYKTAIELDKDIVPILLDDTNLVEELKEYQWIDFRPFSSLNEIHNNEATSDTADSLASGLAAGAVGAIGFVIGGPVGALIGAALVSRGGGILFDPDRNNQELSADDKNKILRMLYKRIVSKAS